MDYIFVTVKNNGGGQLNALYSISKEDVSYCAPNNKYLSELHFKLKSEDRIMDCYSIDCNVSSGTKAYDNSMNVFHGYLLDDFHYSVGGEGLHPAKNYYGVYSHGLIAEENCYFASDELGLSPLYYSITDAHIFVSNNPHLIAIYKRRLGYRINVEPTLPIWHVIGLTIESDNTGYEGIYRVRPWRYISIDCQNNVAFPSKERIDFSGDYEYAYKLSVQELRKGMQTIRRRHVGLQSQLTGGLDSRLVLAFILDAGLEKDFSFSTGGGKDNPDYIVSSMIAKKYGLKHKRLPRNNAKRQSKWLDSRTKQACMANAMESSLVRLSAYQDTPRELVTLNGFGAVFSKSLQFASSFKIFMEKKFKQEVIDYGNLTPSQRAYGLECFGYADTDRFYLTEHALDVSKQYREYIMDFNYKRFPENMNYADAMSAYRWRTHNASLSNKEYNCIFLYSPTVIEASRQLSPELRQEGKLYFDMMWELNEDLCFVPYENRTYNPIIYTHLPADVQARLSSVPSINGDIVSEAQISLFDSLLPILRKDLIDMLPSSVFDYVKREAVEARLKEELPFGKSIFALVNLYGVAKWYEMVSDMNCLSSSELP